jgi:hypothetical protein
MVLPGWPTGTPTPSILFEKWPRTNDASVWAARSLCFALGGIERGAFPQPNKITREGWARFNRPWRIRAAWGLEKETKLTHLLGGPPFGLRPSGIPLKPIQHLTIRTSIFFSSAVASKGNEAQLHISTVQSRRSSNLHAFLIYYTLTRKAKGNEVHVLQMWSGLSALQQERLDFRYIEICI